jgi:hypothetical protein
LAIRIDQVANFVDPPRIFMHQDFRGGHPHVRAALEGACQRLEPARFGLSVVIQQSHKLAVRGRKPLVIRRAEPAILPIPEEY